jgi:hypothetical protein
VGRTLKFDLEPEEGFEPSPSDYESKRTRPSPAGPIPARSGCSCQGTVNQWLLNGDGAAGEMTAGMTLRPDLVRAPR